MNFPKLMLIIGVAVVAIGSFLYFTRVDRSNPAAVATAFTKAMKKQDTKTAASFYMPAKSDAWKTAIDTKIDAMKSGTFTSYFENIPADPVFSCARRRVGDGQDEVGRQRHRAGPHAGRIQVVRVGHGAVMRGRHAASQPIPSFASCLAAR